MLRRAAIPLSRMQAIALAQRSAKGSLPRFDSQARLNAQGFCSLQEFLDWRSGHAEEIAGWRIEEEDAVPDGKAAFSIPGYCAICERSVNFLVTMDYANQNPGGRFLPNWREQLICPSCHMGNRVRAALNFAAEYGMNEDSQIYITEQFGFVYRWLRGRYRSVQGSEYAYPGRPSGYRRFGINHQDIQALSLADSSVDILLTFDVLEHVPDPIAAFTSFSRVIRPGGRLIMTAPFTLDKHETTVRARIREDGAIEHYLPIEIHGNPLDPINGSLCFRHFGWDTLDHLKSVGFVDAKVYGYHSARLGHLGGVQSLISAVNHG